jgi:hypothetical protein
MTADDLRHLDIVTSYSHVSIRKRKNESSAFCIEGEDSMNPEEKHSCDSTSLRVEVSSNDTTSCAKELSGSCGEKCEGRVWEKATNELDVPERVPIDDDAII